VTWASRPIEHQGTSQVLNMDASSISLASRFFPDNPLGIFANFNLQHGLEVEVMEGTHALGTFTPSRTVFLGEVTQVNFDGAFIQASAKSVGKLFDRNVPFMMVQKTCNWALFSAPCGLARSSFAKAGTVDAAAQESTVTVILGSSLAAGWLKGGWIEIQTSTRLVRATILDSSATTDLGGGSHECTLALAQPVTAAQDDPITAFPGCDGRKETCASKFSNFSNFGGFPFIPTTNPTLIKVSKNVTSGGKK
jgi:uncharacterized phage protein (TIGR02218 family)